VSAAARTDHDRRKYCAPRVDAALSRLIEEGVEHYELSAGHFMVADRFEFWPAAGHWRAIGGGPQGGDLSKLIALAKAPR
jgi:hypothetical protein